MNLKEAFRYQKFLDTLMLEACSSIQNTAHAAKVVERHLRSSTNPEAQDSVEETESEDFVKNDDAMLLISRLIFEKEKLSSAIANAKANRTFNIDVAVETNKFRQAAASAIRNMLRFKPNTKKTKGVDYKFDVNGTQVPYRYDVEIVSTDAFNRDYAKQMFNRLMTVSDTISSAVDDVVVNARVEYEPPFDVNSNFEDAVALLLAERDQAE